MKEIIMDALGILIAALASFLINTARNYIKKKIDKIENDALRSLIGDLVAGAEMSYKEIEKAGPQKKDDVISQLADLGFEFTDEINAMIEAAVFRLGAEK